MCAAAPRDLTKCHVETTATRRKSGRGIRQAGAPRETTMRVVRGVLRRTHACVSMCMHARPSASRVSFALFVCGCVHAAERSRGFVTSRHGPLARKRTRLGTASCTCASRFQSAYRGPSAAYHCTFACNSSVSLLIMRTACAAPNWSGSANRYTLGPAIHVRFPCRHVSLPLSLSSSAIRLSRR